MNVYPVGYGQLHPATGRKITPTQQCKGTQRDRLASDNVSVSTSRARRRGKHHNATHHAVDEDSCSQAPPS